MLKTLVPPHSHESGNPVKLLGILRLLDSSFRWNDDVLCICIILGQTGKRESRGVFARNIATKQSNEKVI